MYVSTILKAKGKQVLTIAPDMTVREAAQVLTKNRIGAAVAVGPKGEVAGIISERDIVRGLADQGQLVLDKPVSAIMTAQVTTCTPDDTIQSMMEIMTSGHFRHVPVLENGVLSGIVSIGDVVKNRVEECVLEVDSLRTYVSTSR